MAYKKDYFLEHMEDIIAPAKQVLIVDGGGVSADLSFEGYYLGRPIGVYFFKNMINEWYGWTNHSEPISISTIDSIFRQRDYDLVFEHAHLIYSLIHTLLNNRKDLRDIIIEVDGQRVID